MASKRFFLEDPNVLKHPAAPYMLRMMTAYDVLRSGQRWIAITAPAKNPAQCTEHLVAVLTAVGWANEARKVLKQGWSNKARYIEKSFLENDARLEAIWDELKKDKSDRMKRMKRVRNEYLFHFDPDGADKALQFIQSKGPREFPFVEMGSSPSVGDSRYPMAYVVLGSAFSDGEIDLKKLPKEIESVTSIITDMLALLCALLQGIWDRMGVALFQEGESEAG